MRELHADLVTRQYEHILMRGFGGKCLTRFRASRSSTGISVLPTRFKLDGTRVQSVYSLILDIPEEL